MVSLMLALDSRQRACYTQRKLKCLTYGTPGAHVQATLRVGNSPHSVRQGIKDEECKAWSCTAGFKDESRLQYVF